jgi:hypothetical protein
MFLGNLVKSHQCSSWGSRPLSDGQIHYAACDALVLIRLYDALCCEVEELFGGSVDISEMSVDIDVVCTSPTPSSPSLAATAPSPRQFKEKVLTPICQRKKTKIGFIDIE